MKFFPGKKSSTHQSKSFTKLKLKINDGKFNILTSSLLENDSPEVVTFMLKFNKNFPGNFFNFFLLFFQFFFFKVVFRFYNFFK